MKIWAISDPHLGFGVQKGMDIFGKNWADHPDEMAEHWRALVSPEDIVILSGDISWAINFEELKPDFAFLADLPGYKYINRGNHDYWWVSLQKNRKFCEVQGYKKIDFVRSNAFLLPPAEPEGGLLSKGSLLCGTRGWINPYHPDWKQEDQRYFAREKIRLRLSLDEAVKLRTKDERLIVCLHYPPFGPNGEGTELTEILDEYAVQICLFGHVHGAKGEKIARLKEGNCIYLNTASDVLGFRPLNVGAACVDLLQ